MRLRARCSLTSKVKDVLVKYCHTEWTAASNAEKYKKDVGREEI
jgi:hypothetical protein